jgi:hypothetical protein
LTVVNQPVADGPAPDERVLYLADFLRPAWGGVNTMFTDPPCRIESFTVDGDDPVYVETVGQYRGRWWRFRRQVWPSPHPPLLAAQLYTTSIEERLNTKRLPADGEIVDL